MIRKHISASVSKIKTPTGLLFCTILFDLIGVGILIPVVPQLMANPASPHYLLPPGVSLHTAYLLLGLLIAIYPVGQFLATPILGQLSDKFGRKKLLALSLFGTAIGYILFAIGIYIKSIPLLFISRFFDGVTGGNISIAQAAIADTTAPEKRARVFGIIGVAFGLGFILGPFIGGKLADPSLVSWFTAATPFWFAAIIAILNTLFVLLILPETNMNRRHDARVDWNRSVHNIMRAFTMPKLRTVFGISFLFFAGMGFFSTFFAVFLVERFGFGEGQIGNFFAYIGLLLIFTQGVLMRFIGPRFSSIRILRVTMVVSGCATFLYFAPHVWWGLLLVAPLVSIPNGLSFAHLGGLVSRLAPKEEQGEILGINASVQALAQAIPPILSGTAAALITPEMPIVVGACCAILAGLFFRYFFKKNSNMHPVPAVQ